MLYDISLILIGTFILYLGAEGLIKGSASFALRVGISPLVVGLVIVGYGTSMPELVVSVEAALTDHGAIAIGNVIGSNICNLGLILGISAMMKPISVHRQLIRYDTPIMVSVSILFALLLIDGHLTRWKGAIFILGLIIYSVWSIRFDRAHENEKPIVEMEEDIPHKTKNVWIDWVFIISGIAALYVGSKIFLTGAVSVAQAFGVSDAVIGLSLVALGTSLPELSTSIIAMIKNHRDLAIGNLVGSNIFNILSIIGCVSLIRPFYVEEINWVDFSVMLAFAIALIPIMGNNGVISRREGALLFLSYFAYIGYLYTFQVSY
jgi:cation:H+ antiporter